MARKTDDALLSAHAILTALRSSIRVLRWGMFALVVVYLASGITNIGPNEVGLILRLGKVLPQIHQPGLLFAFPNPIDEVVKVPVKTLLYKRGRCERAKTRAHIFIQCDILTLSRAMLISFAPSFRRVTRLPIPLHMYLPRKTEMKFLEPFYIRLHAARWRV